MRLYLAKCDWFDDYNEVDKIDKCFVFGENLNHAALRLENAFPYINKVTIEEICCDVTDGIFYVPSPYENLDELIEANSY